MKPCYEYADQYAIFDIATGLFFHNHQNGWREEPKLFGRKSDVVQCFNAHYGPNPNGPWRTAVILPMRIRPA